MLSGLIRIFYKLFVSLFIALFFVLTSSFIILLPTGTVRRRKSLMGAVVLFNRLFLKTYSIKIIQKGEENYDRRKSYYIMGNHMTFIDVFAVVSRFRTLFITSNEMKKRPVLGQLAYFAGCLFVERRKITTLKEEIPKIGQVLKSGLNISLFPEATCSDGRALLPFRAGLIESVVGTGVEVLPVCITYRRINGREIRKSDFRTIGYFGGMKFRPQFFKLLRLKSLEAQLEILKPIKTDGKDRKDIKEELFNAIDAKYSEYLASIEE